MWKHIKSIFDKFLITGCLGVLFSIPTASFAQTNLVYNPNCDIYDTCPTGLFQIERALGWFQYDWWGTPDYFNACGENPPATVPSYFGYQLPHSGDGYIHASIIGCQYPPQNFTFWTGPEYGNIQSRETFGGTLTQPLNPVPHKIEFYISPSDYGETEDTRLFTNAFDLILLYNSDSVYNAVTPYINLDDVIKVYKGSTVLKDTANWVKLSACFTPKGGETHFAIGALRDTNEILLEFSGQNFAGVYPASYYFDSFRIFECDTCCLGESDYEDHVTIYDNPGAGGAPVTINVILNPNTTATLSIFDSAGRLVARNEFKELTGSYIFDSRFAAGVYHYLFESSNGAWDTGKILILK